MTLRFLGWLCIVACSSGTSRSGSEEVPRAPSSRFTCSATATILAGQGQASRATVQWRETTVRRLCIDDQWPEAVRRCVATADHDPLSCTAYLETDHQRERWDAAFDKWIESAGH